MTALRTAFVDGEVWQSLIEEHPGYDLATVGDMVIAVRHIRWPTATDYGDFDENGWLRLDPPDALPQ